MTIDISSSPRPGPRPSSSRAEIVQCAIRLLDREGSEALTFRAVARELDITVGALARYFKSLSDLQDEVAAALMSELRPLSATSKLPLRDQLVRVGMSLLDINRERPYLVTTHGPASAAVIARHTAQCLNVMQQAGIEFEQALAIYSLVSNLAYAWGVQAAIQRTPELQAAITQAAETNLADLFPQMKKLLVIGGGTAIFRRWFELYIDALLPAKAASTKAR